MFSLRSMINAYPSASRYRLWLLFAATLLVTLLIGYGLRDSEDKMAYTTAVVVRGDIANLVTATGILQPRDYVDVGAQVSGQLKILHAEVGTEVTEGALLAEIDATLYVAKVDATRAQLRNQRAQLLDRQAQAKLAQVNYHRQINLQKEDATTLESVEIAEASLQSARAQIIALEAQIEQIESSLRAEEANLEFARIYAPMAGTVVSITSRQGQTLNTNQMAPTLLRIADLSVMTVQAQVSEADVSKLRQGTQVYFTTLGSEGRRWYSKLDRIEPTPTVLNNVVLYNALFDVPNANGLLMTQMTTQVFFITAEASDVLLVPMSALGYKPAVEPRSAAGKNSAAVEQSTSPTPGLHHPSRNRESEKQSLTDIPARNFTEPQALRTARVSVMQAAGAIETRTVTLGVTNRIQAEIIAGLEEGEVVITGRQQPDKTKDGAARGFGQGQPRMMR